MARRKHAIGPARHQLVSIDQLSEFTTATVTGDALDTEGFDVAILWLELTARTDGIWTPSVQESESADSGFTPVAAGDLADFRDPDTNAALAPLSFSPHVQNAFYVGSKRYLRWVVTASGSPATGAKFHAGVNLIDPL